MVVWRYLGMGLVDNIRSSCMNCSHSYMMTGGSGPSKEHAANYCHAALCVSLKKWWVGAKSQERKNTTFAVHWYLIETEFIPWNIKKDANISREP